MDSNALPKSAIPFITMTKGKGFEVTPEAEAFLATLEGRRLGVVSVAGKYRTGKSFLMNKLIQQKMDKKGFAVGPTVNSCTKGIWIWPETLPSENPDEPDLELVVLDTEGFGGINENQNHDNRIFIFSLLLSSLFIYNSVGSIDEHALQTLSLIVNLAKNIQLSETRGPEGKPVSESQVSDFSNDVSALGRLANASAINDQQEDAIIETFPFFLWVIRDFCLELKDAHGNPITSRTYFENALKNAGPGGPNDGKNKVRTLLKHFFRSRECVTMVRPVEKETDLQSLDLLDESCLRPEFILQMKKTRKLVLMKATPKKIRGAVLDGPKLVHLTRAYVQAINSGAAPNVDSAWNYILQFENEKKLRHIYSKLRSSRSMIRNQGEIDSLIESVFVDFDNERIGTAEETDEVKKKFEEEVRQELGNDCSRFVEHLGSAVRTAAEDQMEALKKEVLEMDSFNAHALEQLTERRMEALVEQFRDQSNTQAVRSVAERLFAQGKGDILQLALRQMEKANAKEARVLAAQKAETERRLQEANEQLSFRVEQIERQSEAELQRMAELVRENEQLANQTQELKSEREHLTAKLQDKETKFQWLESQVLETTKNERAALVNEVEELTSRLAERESTAQKETVLLNGKLKYLESSLQKTKADLQVREAEFAEAKTQLLQAERLVEELTYKLKVQSVTVPETHVMVEKGKWGELREKAAANDDLRENYEKVIREVIEERNMIQGQFEFLKENFELEKNKNFRLLREIHDKIARKTTATGVEEAGESRGKWADREVESSPEAVAEVPEVTISNAIIVKDSDGDASDKGAVLYCIDINSNGRVWTIQKKFRDFFDLAVKLRRSLKRVELPPSTKELWSFARDIWGVAGSKSFPLEQRKLLLERVVRDLASLSVVRSEASFQNFLKDENFKD